MSVQQIVAPPVRTAAPGARPVAWASARASVRGWLWVVAGCIFAMVVLGGATRLTQSGLSITEWKPVAGVIPPLSAQAWEVEFAKYRAIPQYAERFPAMDLAGFKAIFYWEWAHRLLGRVIGLVVAVPLVGFWIGGCLTASLKPRLVGLFALGGLQGAIGWWMVRSGLSTRVDVSQYRLAVHLVVAALTFAWAVWLAEGLRPERSAYAGPERPRATAGVLVALVVLQLALGALVAGLHAGLTYNTWPLMDGHLVPPLADLTRQAPLWSNLFENVTTVQFDHRCLAYVLLAVAAAHALDCRRTLPATPAARGAALLFGLLLLQGALGVTALLLAVPLVAALAHQAFAMIVLGAAVVHRRRLGAGYGVSAPSRA